jgi:signal transduction histidine kinase
MPAKILVAEDSPTQAERLRYLLEQHGYEVRVAPNGRKALELARESPPTMIISDVVMPEMDGYTLCREVKNDVTLGDVAVILVTTLSDAYDVIRGLECRADNFIIKPFDAGYLLGRVQYVLVNREMRRTQEAGMGVEIFFNGNRHFITADRLQILNLLLSTYDAAVQRNRELVRSREELQSVNAKLAASNKELESFSYAVSHDLRAPLRHIDGYVHMLAEDDETSFSAEAKRYLGVISEAARQMERLIEDLLLFSRNARTEMHEAPVDLTRLLHEVVQGLEMQTRERHIVWKIPPLPEVIGDRSMLRQVFANLIGNAVKYTAPRNPAHIELGHDRGEDGRIVVYVRDDGVGFDMKYADKLFGVFQRLHSAAEFEGTGIGLANVHRIVARHGGRIWAEAAPDQGATFYFTLRPVAAD